MADKEVKRDDKGRRILVFYCIDYWNKAVFRDSLGYLFGSLDILFSATDKPENIVKRLENEDIYYFSRRVDDDPLGELMNRDKIVLTVKKK